MELRKRGRPKIANPRNHRFEMRLTEEELRKLFYLARRYHEKSAADFLLKFVNNEYEFCMQEDEEKRLRVSAEIMEEIKNIEIGDGIII